MPAQSRPGTADDAIRGVQPKFVYSPSTVEECAEVMALGARDKLRLGFAGGRTEIGLGAPPSGLDAVVATERLGRIVEYTPSDMVLIAEAGTPLARIQATARAEGQMLAIDPPEPERATIGGIVATGGFGPRRARYGTIRDLIIGVTLVRADGTVAHGGGKVVKNVAGFDLPKVACGSLGTLGLIATASFRLHPLPEASATARLAGLTAAQVVATVDAMRRAQLEPTSVEAIRGAGGAYDLGVRFEGFGKGVSQQMVRLGDLARGVLPDEAFWRAPARAPFRARVASLPSRLPAVDALVEPILAALGAGATFSWYATLGLGSIAGPVADEAALAAAVGLARSALVDSGGSLVVHSSPVALDPWGPLPQAFRLMAELKKRFDPDGRLNPGRFVGGL